jgi:protein O-GlcNAc transferase
MNFLPGHQLALLARRCGAAPVHTSWLRNFHGSMASPFVHHAIVDRRAANPARPRTQTRIRTPTLTMPLPLPLTSSSSDLAPYRHVLPPREARAWVEAPVWLPHSHLVNSHLLEPWATAERGGPPSRRKAGAAAAAAAAGVEAAAAAGAACSFNRLNKLEPTLLSVWAAGVARTRAPLLIATGAASGALGGAQAEAALRAEAAALGLSVRRVRFARRTATDAEHAARVARCALALDARIWGAHTTGLDALAAGVGLLSAQGSHFASRAGASLLAALGAPHGLATHGLRAYSDALAALLAPAGARAPAWRAARGARRTARRVRPSRIEVTL